MMAERKDFGGRDEAKIKAKKMGWASTIRVCSKYN